MADGSRTALEAAAQAGLLAPDQVAPLADFLSQRAAPASQETPVRDGEEPLRFIRNFQDVFLAIGIAVLGLGMLIWVVSSLPTMAVGGPMMLWGPAAIAAVCAGVMWGIAEAFAGRRRLFLPAIASCLGVTSFVFFAAVLGFAAMLNVPASLDFDGIFVDTAFGLSFTAIAAAAVAAAAFYWRFRLPFSLAVLGISLSGLLFVVAVRVLGEPSMLLMASLMVLAGAALFAAGVAFDMRDPERKTRFSDNGFWLHFAAAPLLLNGALWLIVPLVNGGEAFGVFALNTVSAVVTLCIVAVLGLISLLINRRALIVSALITTGAAISVLLQTAGLGEATVAAGALVVLGGGVLVLGSGWAAARRALLGRVRPDGFWARIFPPEAPE